MLLLVVGNEFVRAGIDRLGTGGELLDEGVGDPGDLPRRCTPGAAVSGFPPDAEVTGELIGEGIVVAVSYTHLDVYKRQLVGKDAGENASGGNVGLGMLLVFFERELVDSDVRMVGFAAAGHRDVEARAGHLG